MGWKTRTESYEPGFFEHVGRKFLFEDFLNGEVAVVIDDDHFSYPLGGSYVEQVLERPR